MFVEKLSCDLNVELCISRRDGMKYMSSFAHEARDQVTVQIPNEIAEHEDVKPVVEFKCAIVLKAARKILKFWYIDREVLLIRPKAIFHGHCTVYYPESDEWQEAGR